MIKTSQTRIDRYLRIEESTRNQVRLEEVRQGYSLSPLLLNIDIEELATQEVDDLEEEKRLEKDGH